MLQWRAASGQYVRLKICDLYVIDDDDVSLSSPQVSLSSCGDDGDGDDNDTCGDNGDGDDFGDSGDSGGDFGDDTTSSQKTSQYMLTASSKSAESWESTLQVNWRGNVKFKTQHKYVQSSPLSSVLTSSLSVVDLLAVL